MLCDGCEGVGVGKSEGGEGGRLEATDEAELTETSGGGPGTCARVCVCVCMSVCVCVRLTFILGIGVCCCLCGGCGLAVSVGVVFGGCDGVSPFGGLLMAPLKFNLPSQTCHETKTY